MRAAAASRSAGAGASWWHALPLWLISGLGAGLGNQIPQQWLAAHAPEHKSQLLAVALLAGAVASLLGVWLVAERRIDAGATRWTLLLGLVGAAGLTLALSGASGLPGFAVGFLLLRAGLNALTQLLDRQLVLGRMQGGGNLANTAWRLVGMSSGSLAFAYAAERPTWLVAGVVGLCALSVASVWSLLRTAMDVRPAETGRAKGLPLLAADRWLLGAGWAAYATLYLFAADLAYLLADFLGIDEPQAKAGRLLLVVYGASVVGAGLCAAWERWRGPLGGGAFVVAGGMIGLGAACGLLPFAASWWVLGGLAVAMGGAHALFLSAARTWLTRAARAGRSSLLGSFNNLPNWGALGGFAGLAVVAWSSGRSAPAFHPRVLGLIGLLAVVSAVCGWMVGRKAAEEAHG